jgi:hypothetical protein
MTKTCELVIDTGREKARDSFTDGEQFLALKEENGRLTEIAAKLTLKGFARRLG